MNSDLQKILDDVLSKAGDASIRSVAITKAVHDAAIVGARLMRKKACRITTAYDQDDCAVLIHANISDVDPETVIS